LQRNPHGTSGNINEPNPGIGERQGFSIRNLKTFKSFKNPVFSLYFGGLLGQMVGVNMQMMTRSFLVYELTDSAFLLGVMSLFFAVPMVLFSLFGGVIADRIQKKYIMLYGQAASAIVSAAVGFTLLTGYLNAENPWSWWILGASSFFQGIIMALMMPSIQAILPEIVEGEDLMNAISLNTMGTNTLRLLAPAAAGFLIDYVGYEAVYFTTAIAYLISVVFIAFLPKTSTIKKKTTNVLSSIKEGIKYLKSEKTILLIMVFTLVITILAMPFQQLLPIFVVDVLHKTPQAGGFLMSVSGIGSIISSLILASLPNKKRGLMMLGANIVLGVALFSFALSTSYPLSLVLIGFVGIGQMVQMALGTTLIQYYSDPVYIGRLMSIMMMQFGLMSFSTFVAGALTELTGNVQWAIGGLALILVILAISAIIFVKKLRNLE
jgi:MFS family permease